jgi:hypothetical protein
LEGKVAEGLAFPFFGIPAGFRHIFLYTFPHLKQRKRNAGKHFQFFILREISEKVLQGGRARCPTYEKSITYIRVGRAPSPAKKFFQRPLRNMLTYGKRHLCFRRMF